jgi:hypothetical protein
MNGSTPRGARGVLKSDPAFIAQSRSAASRNQKRRFDRINRMNRIDLEWELNSESVFYPVNPVHPVKTLPEMRSFRI